MTVRDVLEYLKQLPPDQVVEVFDSEGEQPEKLEKNGSYEIAVG